MPKLKFTIYLKNGVAEFNTKNYWIESHVDEWRIRVETRLLELKRYSGANTIINLNEVIFFNIAYEKE